MTVWRCGTMCLCVRVPPMRSAAWSLAHASDWLRSVGHVGVWEHVWVGMSCSLDLVAPMACLSVVMGRYMDWSATHPDGMCGIREGPFLGRYMILCV